jgi:quercetin dioxygenase-like cupin family protein
MIEMPSAAPLPALELAGYQGGAVVSRTLLKRAGGTITLFAFDEGQALSEHTAPFDAIVQVLDGEAQITIAGTPLKVAAGEMLHQKRVIADNASAGIRSQFPDQRFVELHAESHE